MRSDGQAMRFKFVQYLNFYNLLEQDNRHRPGSFRDSSPNGTRKTILWRKGLWNRWVL